MKDIEFKIINNDCIIDILTKKTIKKDPIIDDIYSESQEVEATLKDLDECVFSPNNDIIIYTNS